MTNVESILSVATKEQQNVPVSAISAICTTAVAGYFAYHIVSRVHRKISDRKFEKSHVK